MKRVYCLYRVSTKGQVDHDDIPMQRTACRAFAERNGWTICKEFLEKGVSGYKTSAEDRDAIQDLKIAAEKKEFDILLVFMFDRLGRIPNEKRRIKTIGFGQNMSNEIVKQFIILYWTFA